MQRKGTKRIVVRRNRSEGSQSQSRAHSIRHESPCRFLNVSTDSEMAHASEEHLPNMHLRCPHDVNVIHEPLGICVDLKSQSRCPLACGDAVGSASNATPCDSYACLVVSHTLRFLHRCIPGDSGCQCP
jgi:hypothetical protein